MADGGDVTDHELGAAIPDPLALNRSERYAWEELSHWADDEDIRANDPSYSAYKRERMRDHIAALHGYSPEEIERGEHQAWHMPVWGCGVTILLVAAAAYLFLR